MAETLRDVCIFSFLCSSVLALMPSGGPKRILTLLCTAEILYLIIIPFVGFDFSEYSLSTARYREQSERIGLDAEELSKRYEREVIESECRAYIMDKAEKLGLELNVLSLELQWDTEGFWRPESVRICCAGGKNAELSSVIEAELGIAQSEQEWYDDDRSQEADG